MPVRKHNRTELTGKHATPAHPPRKGVSTPALRNAPRVRKEDDPIAPEPRDVAQQNRQKSSSK